MLIFAYCIFSRDLGTFLKNFRTIWNALGLKTWRNATPCIEIPHVFFVIPNYVYVR